LKRRKRLTCWRAWRWAELGLVQWDVALANLIEVLEIYTNLGDR
jgi:hypothetical protein